MSRLQTLNNKIEFFAEQENEDSFLVYTKQKLLLTRKLDRLDDWLETYVDLQDFYSHDHSKALQYLDEALRKKWREPKNPDEWEQFLYLYTFQGYHLSQLSRIWPAVQAYESARTLYEKHRFADYETVQWLYKPLGNHYTRLGDNEKALVVFQKALLQQNTPDELAGLYVNIGLACWNRGEMQTAEKNCETGLRLKGISSAKQALLYGVLALVFLDTNRPEQAVAFSEKALRFLNIQTQVDAQRLEDRARIRRTAGLAYARIGNPLAAQKLLEGALADIRRATGSFSGRDVAKIELAFCEHYRLLGQPLKAVEASNRALVAVLPGFKMDGWGTNPSATSFYEENTIFEALISKAGAGVGLYNQNGGTHWLLMALECHDLAYLAEKRLRAVYQYESSKLELQSDAKLREASVMDVVRLLYEKTGSAQYLEKGFEIAERSKSNLLTDALRENLIMQNQANNQQFQKLVSLRQTAAWYNKQLILEPGSNHANNWRAELDALVGKINQLKRSIPGIGVFEGDNQNVGAVALAGDTGNGVVLEYFTGERFTEVFTVHNHAVISWKRFPNDAELHRNVVQFQSYFTDANAILNDPDGYLETAYWLCKRLLPEQSTLTDELIVVPDGFVHYIPFEALVTVKPSVATTLRNADYLIRSQRVRYAWSLHALNRQNVLPTGTPKFLLGVAPVFANSERGLAPLPASPKEWSAFGMGTVNTLIGKTATADSFLNASVNYRIVHLSTHASANTSENRSPGIELFDQTLLLPDIYAMNLQTTLIVLSACETGLGVDYKGEGVMSLARAFAQAGAACVVSSLWTVNDQSTAQVLYGFYRNIKNEYGTISSALRQAKLSYINDEKIPAVRQSPYFWAGLIEVGSDRKIKAVGDRYMAIVLGACTLFATFLVLFEHWQALKNMSLFLFKKKKTTTT